MAGISSRIFGVRAALLFVAAVQFLLAHPLRAQDSSVQDHSIGEKLPLFATNHCAIIRDQAEQLFCGDAELNVAASRLNDAVQARLSRLPDRSLAVEENVAWIRARNSSCGIFGRDAVRFDNLEAVRACLLRETEERIAILRDPNFDCLATNTAAGSLICGDPQLALAETELNGQVLALIAKLGDDDARKAFSEYARWTRGRDRKCGVAGKDNVPQDELEAAVPCLADVMRDRAAEFTAAKGDPRRVFGRQVALLRVDADAVDLCVAEIHAANGCSDFLRIRELFEITSAVSEPSAQVTTEVEMVVLSPFAVCSPIASSCTGTCWDLKSGMPKTSGASRDSFLVAHRIRIRKVFAFEKTASGWRCNATALQPIDYGTALAGP
jgi:uncharacterized protein YecT (DUF1311 family)